MNELLEKQLETFSDDTFNYLVELRSVSYGAYLTLIDISKRDSKQAKVFMNDCTRYWNKWLAAFNPNIFEIIYAARKGIIQ